MKRLEIKLIDDDNEQTLKDGYILPSSKRTRLYEYECHNILKKFEERTLSRDDLENAIDTIIAYYCKEQLYKTIIDIDTRNKSLAPAKEMTLEEIEVLLGHKIKIVSDEEEKENE